jgi:hypothetical protein
VARKKPSNFLSVLQEKETEIALFLYYKVLKERTTNKERVVVDALTGYEIYCLYAVWILQSL